jgi:ribose-phosphate pyrophosphokinase
MIKINDEVYEYSKFPNGEIRFTDVRITNSPAIIEWIYENNEEFFIIQMLVKYLREYCNSIALEVPFCPYGQQDRKIKGQIFSFKYFAQILNDMNLDDVTFYDPHSIVMNAAIKNSTIKYLDLSKEKMEEFQYDMAFYPDNGAAKKYSEIYPDIPYRYGNKKRNLDNGDIICYEVIADKQEIEGKNILIVDDLCMGGTTFKEAAKALKEMGAKRIGLQITFLMPNSLEFVKNIKDFGIDEIITYEDGISQFVLNQIDKEDSEMLYYDEISKEIN